MKYRRVTMRDGSKWDVPVDVIARNRAEFYAREFDGDVEKSLKEDTLPTFEGNGFEIQDWAQGNMNWDEVSHAATKVSEPPTLTPADFQYGWVNGDSEIVEK